MNLTQLEYFKTIAEYEHYGLASEKLKVSQPSLSRSMANLEQELGLYLFEKQGRGVSLTKYGRIFLEHATRILDEVHIAEVKMTALAGSESGHIDIAYVFPLSVHYIPYTVRSFLKSDGNQHVTFSFTQALTHEMVTGLKHDQFDVIFGSYVPNEPDLTFVPILKQEMVIIVPPDHPLASEISVDLSQLENYPIISYDKTSGLGLFTRSLWRDQQIQPNIFSESSDEHAITALVASGFGIALVADVAAIHSGSVVILPLKGHSIHHIVYMAYHKNRFYTPSVQNFIQFVIKQDYQDPIREKP